MKQFKKFALGLLAVLSLSLNASDLPPDWPFAQKISVSATGLIKFSLPLSTLSTARPGLEDLRLMDSGGKEVPYVLKRTPAAPPTIAGVKAFQLIMNADRTEIILETGARQPLDAVFLETPAEKFLKAVSVETSEDGANWNPLIRGQSIFREPDGAANLKISFPATNAAWLRLTVDDSRSAPIPFTGANVGLAVSRIDAGERMPAIISERTENTGQTRLDLNLGAGNLDLISLKIQTTDALFIRRVLLAVPEINGEDLREKTIGGGVIYQTALEGQPPASNLMVPVENLIHSRDLILFIENGDSPPLSIAQVEFERRPLYLIFRALKPGDYYLLSGNAQCAQPNYDLAALTMDWKSLPLAAVQFLPLSNNSAFHAAEVLPGLETTGAPLDVSKWKFRKPIHLSSNGVYQVELDQDVLAHSAGTFADLRVMQGHNQIPYILESTSIKRLIDLPVKQTNDLKNPQLSRWIIELPQANLPVTNLSCFAATPLFERVVSLDEEWIDEGGTAIPRKIGGAVWRQTPDSKIHGLSLALEQRPAAKTLILETDNGDNSPISLHHFTAAYSATRLLFKTGVPDGLFLYYGNPQAPAPSYDLNLVASQLISAEKKIAALSGQQILTGDALRRTVAMAEAGIWFWVILGLVVVVLVVIIARLLPKNSVSA